MTPSTINELSTSLVPVKISDENGIPAPPSNVIYQIDCLTSGVEILAPTEISAPGAAFKIEVTATQNRIVDQTNPQEYRRMTLVANYGNGDKLTAQFDWIVNNLNFIT